MRQYRKEQAAERLKLGDMWQASDRVFTSWAGRPMHPDVASAWFAKFLKRYGLHPLPFHGLRHTCATLLINQGIPLKNVSGRLGHSNTTTTVDIYGHYLQTADRAISDTLEQAFQSIKKGQA
ncbi:MAG: site-specific integrase [Bacillota bacterium]|nr:site-specific integrase [Bacillota bacterium]